MKVVLLAGGLGTRLSEETDVVPKPMVEIGGMPILWHIMKGYAAEGHTDFVIALGYKGEIVRRFFHEYAFVRRSTCVRLQDGRVLIHDAIADEPKSPAENWTVHLIDTGAAAQTGERVLALQRLIGFERFLLSYGDGLSDVDISRVLATHEARRGIPQSTAAEDLRLAPVATITAVRPLGRFGALDMADGDSLVHAFTEKRTDAGWINGGFMVLEPEIFRYLARHKVLEHALADVALAGALRAHQHAGFWQCMDTLREKRELEKLWQSGEAPWSKRWQT